VAIKINDPQQDPLIYHRYFSSPDFLNDGILRIGALFPSLGEVYEVLTT
jgi:hypothetical protein